MHNQYFSNINRLLQEQGVGEPIVLIDLDALDSNLGLLKSHLPADAALRLVVKSLPCHSLLQYISDSLFIRRAMVFSAEHLRALAALHVANDPSKASGALFSDLLLGKPLPVRALSGFLALYHKHTDFIDSIQWLVDSRSRLEQYLTVAREYGVRLRINVEVDVGLHRCAISTQADLLALLQLISENPSHCLPTGLMGYDAHVTKLPRILGKPEALYRTSQDVFTTYIRTLSHHCPMPISGWCINGAGSSSFRLHGQLGTVCNDVSVGSVLLKPTDFDSPLSEAYQPAVYIAAPILKADRQPVWPGLEKMRALLNRHTSYFISGGKWMQSPFRRQA